MDFSYEATPALGEGFDEARFFSVIPESFAQLFYGIVQPLIEIHEGVGWPNSLLEFFAADYLTGALQQDPEDLACGIAATIS